MECRFCQRAFFKGEHLRRHERSHTGAKPFVCKECNRSFSRQDSLIRHARAHARKESAGISSPSSGIPSIITPPNSGSLEITNETDVPISLSFTQNQALPKLQCPPSADLRNRTPPPELDFALIWPDSEDLFQSIMSSDSVNQWQIPLGTLTCPSESYATSNTSFGSPSSFDDRVPSIDAIPSGGNHQAVHDVSRLIANLSSSVTAEIESTCITSVFLDECLHMFFVRFIPTFPVLHRATFVFRDCTHPLLLNAIAIGSLYLGPTDAIAKGEALWRLAHTAMATSWQTLIAHRGPYDACEGVQLVVTTLLGQVYGALSKNGAIRTTSQAFHALGFFWARHCGMLESKPFSINDLPASNASKEEKEYQWRVWVSREIQQRAVLAHFMLDGLVAQMSGEPSSLRHTSNPLGLPSSEAAFEAGTAEEWLIHLRSQQYDQSSFRSIIRELFSPTDDYKWLSHNFSAFTYRVLLEALQSLISDCDEEAEAAVGVPNKTEIRRALARVYESIVNAVNLPASERLETLLRWHAVCLDAVISSSLLCRYVCCRCNIEQHVWENNKRMKPDFDFVQWANCPDGRRALLHAVAIQDIVEQLPRGRAHVVHMPSSLFAAATVYSVFSLAGLTTVNLPGTVDWKDVLCTINDPCLDSGELPGSALSSVTTRYIRDAITPDFGIYTTRNLLYEFNSMQKLFRCLSSQWGIAIEMEKVVGRWTTLCH